MDRSWRNTPAKTTLFSSMVSDANSIQTLFSVKFNIILLWSLFSGLIFSSCAGNPRYTITGSSTAKQGGRIFEKRIRCTANNNTIIDSSITSYQKTGKASFYGENFHGRKTASGELYDRALFTAAHRTLPFGTMVKVTNSKNGKSVIVRINDRGPHKRDRIIDLSYAAAIKLDMVRSGLVSVIIECVKVP